MSTAPGHIMHVTIRRNSDGLVRVDHWKDWMWTGEGDEYWWSSGNFGCDCNRADCFDRAGGDEPAGDRPCGRDAYSVLSITQDDDPTVLYRDGDLDEEPSP